MERKLSMRFGNISAAKLVILRNVVSRSCPTINFPLSQYHFTTKFYVRQSENGANAKKFSKFTLLAPDNRKT